MDEQKYRKLAEHLDRLPGGFAPSETGAELRLLKRLFTPEEAELAIHLTLDREEAAVIASRAGIPPGEAEQRLSEMAHKGLVFSARSGDGGALYQAVPWVVGIWEFQVNRLSDGLLQDIADYGSTRIRRPRVQTISQMRTIPIGESIESHLEVLPHEHVEGLIAAHDRFAVAPCICRRTAHMSGEGCDGFEEACLMLDDWADYYVQHGRGRSIDRSEVMEILARADADNLVLQPTNSRDVAAICCCCGCCCGVLGGLQRHPKPADVVVNAFRAKYDPDACIGCLACLERCQMEALTAEGDGVALKADRCIGCGLCVSTCPSGALALERKPAKEQPSIPVDMDATWRTISEAQAKMG